MTCLHPDCKRNELYGYISCYDRAVSCHEKCDCCNPNWEANLFFKERLQLLELAKRVSEIFSREPDDSADFVDASSKIHKVWREARSILGVKDVEESVEDS